MRIEPILVEFHHEWCPRLKRTIFPYGPIVGLAVSLA